jgi:hypothetical protein
VLCGEERLDPVAGADVEGALYREPDRELRQHDGRRMDACDDVLGHWLPVALMIRGDQDTAVRDQLDRAADLVSGQLLEYAQCDEPHDRHWRERSLGVGTRRDRPEQEEADERAERSPGRQAAELEREVGPPRQQALDLEHVLDLLDPITGAVECAA